jgi:hypothetical protein
MPVETAADRLAFLNVDEFGVEATYRPSIGGLSWVIQGIFDSDASVIEVGGEVPVQSRRPRLVCRVDDITDGGNENDTVTLSSAQLLAAGLDTNAAGTYRVIVVQPDGTGMVELALEKQS